MPRIEKRDNPLEPVRLYKGKYHDENEDEKVVSAQDSGFNVFGDAREIKSVRLKNGKILILVAQNQNKLLAFEEF